MFFVSDQSIFMILSLAEEYQIWNLKQKCEESLLLCLNNEKSQNEEILLKCLHASDEFKLFALWTKCLQIISKPSLSMTSLQRSRGYENLSRFLKSMLEAFKGTTRDEVSKPATHTSLSSGRRDSTHFINETNLKKAYSTSFTQTKSQSKKINEQKKFQYLLNVCFLCKKDYQNIFNWKNVHDYLKTYDTNCSEGVNAIF